MLTVRSRVEVDGISIADVVCRHHRGRGEAEPAHARMLVIVRRGYFVRRVNGVPSVLDPTLAYCVNPDDEQRFDHPHDAGDDCTAIGLDDELAASVWGGEPSLPTQVLTTSPRLDLAHRMLLAATRRGEDRHALFEGALRLVAATLASAGPALVGSARPAGARARRALVDAAREALVERPDRSLPEIARHLSVSPHHLSRVFSSVSGHTISRHRMQLRTREALERLAQGEDNLARLATDTGFADQSHLCRVMRCDTGAVPSVLRRLLR